jgi:hypothetical protein
MSTVIGTTTEDIATYYEQNPGTYNRYATIQLLLASGDDAAIAAYLAWVALQSASVFPATS